MKFFRGDTYKFKFQRTSLDGEIIKNKADEVWFTVKENYNTSTKIIQKTLSSGEITFDSNNYYCVTILPSDTSNLDYKNYVWDIQIKQGNNITTISSGKMKLKKEVTFEVE